MIPSLLHNKLPFLSFLLHFASTSSLLALINHSIHLPSVSFCMLPLLFCLLAFFKNVLSQSCLIHSDSFSLLVFTIRSGVFYNSDSYSLDMVV
jgi:hypothetical protein